MDYLKIMLLTTLTLRSWLMGFLISEYELNGKDRAKYGDEIYEKLAERLGKKLNVRNLYLYMRFYHAYPQILQTVSAKFQLPDFINNSIVQTVSAQLKALPYTTQKSTGTLATNSEKLISRLSFSPFIELINLTPTLKRKFYEVETLKNNWSVRELKRAINSMLYERVGISKDKAAMLADETKAIKLEPEDAIKNSYVLEFLGLDEKPRYSETDFEEAIIDNLQKFLLEAGHGFCFEARQNMLNSSWCSI